MKVLKKIMALAMCVIPALGAMGITAFAAPSYTFETGGSTGLVPATQVLFEESFNGTEDLGTNNAVWGKNSTYPLTVISRTSTSNSSKGYLWVNNTGGQQYYKLKSENAIKGIYTTEFKFNKTVNNTVGSSSASNMFFGAGYTGDTNESYAIQLFIDENDKPYYIGSDNSKQYFFTDTAVWTGGGCNFYRDWSWNEGSWLNKTSSTAATGAENEDWYTVKIVADTQNAVYSVYLNGVLCVKDAAFIPQSGQSWSETGINMPYIMASDSAVGIRYVYDDLKLYREPMGYTTVYANDFNSYNDSKVWSGSDKNYSGIAGLGLAAFGGKGGKTLTASSDGTLASAFDGATGKGGAIILGPVAQNNMTVETDFSVNDFTEDAHSDKWATVLVLGSSSKGEGARIAVNKEGEIGIGYYQAASPIMLSRITLNENHHIALCADFTKSTYDLYLDGKLILENQGLTRRSNVKILSGADLMIALGYHENAPTTTVKYDNLKIYTDGRDDAFSNAKAQLKDIFPGSSYIMKEVTLPSEINGYSIKWSADEGANLAVAADGKTAAVTQTSAKQAVTLRAEITDGANGYTAVRNVNVTIPAGPNAGINNDAENKKITAEARNVPSGTVLMLAIYSDNKLVGIATKTTTDSEKKAEIDYSKYADGSYSVKAFLLKNSVGIEPYCSAAGPVRFTVGSQEQ